VLIVAWALENPDAAREVIRAALEGCLVVAGLVAASSEAALRKLDLLGTGGTVLAGVCRGILAHRPARRTCQACAGRMALAPPPARAGDPRAGGAQAAGCESCDWTGYEGTTGLFELALPDDEAAPGRKILHVREGLTFAADARAKVAARLLDEVEALRVLGRDPDSGALPAGVALEGKAR
jgi:type II secretory ATPase GspE/PulE/Tfp pilus assembly ATPase PilB-like protein